MILMHTSQELTSGGSGSGDLAHKIKLTKVDEDDNSITLANAVFTVTQPDGTTFNLTTGADGTVTSEALVQGTYKVKETIAPAGYELNNTEYTLQVTATDGALQTISDKPIKTNISVTKTWVGPKGRSYHGSLIRKRNRYRYYSDTR